MIGQNAKFILAQQGSTNPEPRRAEVRDTVTNTGTAASSDLGGNGSLLYPGGIDSYLPLGVIALLTLVIFLAWRTRRDVASIPVSPPNWGAIISMCIAVVLFVASVATYMTRLETRIAALERRVGMTR